MFARLGTAFMVAVLVGPIIGGGVATLFNSLRAPLYFAAGLSAIAFVCSYFYLVEPGELIYPRTPTTTDTLLEAAEEPQQPQQGNASIGIEEDEGKPPPSSPWLDPWNVAIGFETFLTSVAFNGLTSLSALLLLEPRYEVVDLGDSIAQQGEDMSLQIGFNTMILAGASIPTMLFFFGHAINCIGVLMTGFIGCFIFGTSIFLLPETRSIGGLMGVYAATGVAAGLEMNVSTISLARRADPSNVAKTLAIGQLFDSVAMILGPFLTLLYRINLKTPFRVSDDETHLINNQT